MPKSKEGKPNRYDAIILRLFEDNYKEGITEFEFTRDKLESIAKILSACHLFFYINRGSS